ncbi:unnamed protein product, partial [marine sediment metagenome]
MSPGELSERNNTMEPESTAEEKSLTDLTQE